VPEEDIPLEQESAITIAIAENEFDMQSTIGMKIFWCNVIMHHYSYKILLCNDTIKKKNKFFQKMSLNFLNF